MNDNFIEITNESVIENNGKPVIEVTSEHVIDDGNETDTANRWRWGWGCFLVLGGLCSGNFLMMIVWMAMGAVLIPPSAKKIEEYFEITLDKKLMTSILVGGGIATFLLAAMMTGSGYQGASDADYDKWINRVGEIGSPMP